MRLAPSALATKQTIEHRGSVEVLDPFEVLPKQ
jgi:hypothetical protein